MLLKKICFLVLLLIAPLVQAQPNFKANAFSKTYVVQEETVKVYAGPSSAYNSKAKLFKGNQVKILKFSADQKWAEIQTDEIKGWVVTSFLIQAQGAQEDDAGRIEKKTDYQYDGNGKRIQGGMKQRTEDENELSKRPVGFKPEKAEPYFFRLSILPGMTLLKREFSSDISFNSPLQKLVAQGNVYQTNLKSELIFSDYIGLNFNFQDARMNFDLAAHPYSFNPKNTTLSMERQNFNALIELSYPLTPSWKFSLATGIQIQRSYIQQIKESSSILNDRGQNANVNYAPLLQHLSVILPIGVHIRYQISAQLFGKLEGGAWLPLSLSQAPLNTGKWNGLGFWSDLMIGYDLTQTIGIVAAVQWNYLVYAFEGPGTQYDSVAQQRFLNSMSADISLGASLGLSVRF